MAPNIGTELGLKPLWRGKPSETHPLVDSNQTRDNPRPYTRPKDLPPPPSQPFKMINRIPKVNFSQTTSTWLQLRISVLQLWNFGPTTVLQLWPSCNFSFFARVRRKQGKLGLPSLLGFLLLIRVSPPSLVFFAPFSLLRVADWTWFLNVPNEVKFLPISSDF